MKLSRIWLALTALVGPTGEAWATTSPEPATAPTAVLDAPAHAVAVPPPERRWRLGAALGYGERSNPLIQSKDIPVLVDLDVAYFGDRWFFDNGDLGLALTDHRWFSTNLVARVNSDRAFFSKTNTKYVTYAVRAGGFTTSITDPQTGTTVTEPQPLRPPRRSYAVEAGLETLMSGDWGQASLLAFHDVSGTHEGYEIAAQYSYRFTHGRFTLAPSLGLAWKSADLSDYYWGVRRDEATNTLSPYEAHGGLGWEAGMKFNYYLSKKTRLALAANYERLQHSVAMSPLVARNYVFGYFAGMAWQF